MNQMDRTSVAEIRELTIVLRTLVEEVKELSVEMKRLKEDQLPGMLVTHGVQGEKISRLETLLYGSLAAIALEGLGLATALVMWVLTR